MKLLIVSNGYPPTAYGGVENYSHSIARSFAQRGWDVSVVCRESNPAQPDYTQIDDMVENIPVYRIVNDYKDTRDFSTLYTDPRIDQAFGDILEKRQPDVILFNHLIALSANLPHVSASRKIPSIFMLHDYWTICHRVNLIDQSQHRCPGPLQGGDCFRCVFIGQRGPGRRAFVKHWIKMLFPYAVKSRLKAWMKRSSGAPLIFKVDPEDMERRQQVFREAVKEVDRIAAPSNFVKEMMAKNGYAERPIDVLPLGLDISKTEGSGRPTPTQEIHFGFIGPILPIKGIDILVKAFRGVPGDHISLTIYGRDDVQPDFSRKVHRIADADRRIQFAGSFNSGQREEVFRKISVLIIPSITHETYSFVAREALAYGVPVIASTVGALTEIIQPGVNGWAVPPDDVAALRNVIASISTHPDLLSKPGFMQPEPYVSIEDHSQNLEMILRSIIK